MTKTPKVSLWADALDFAGDAANYALSLVVLSMSLYWRATAITPIAPITIGSGETP
jgi:Co/Zn/Cd efflux system component